MAQVVIRMEWKGLAGRMLMWDDFHVFASSKLFDDRFAKTIPLSWSDLRDNYFGALRRVALPILTLFATQGWFQPETWLTPEAVRDEFSRLQVGTMKMFEDA